MDQELPLARIDLRVLETSGMVSAQAECTVAQALTKMSRRAEAAEQTMETLADAVLERSIQFDAR